MGRIAALYVSYPKDLDDQICDHHRILKDSAMSIKCQSDQSHGLVNGKSAPISQSAHVVPESRNIQWTAI